LAEIFFFICSQRRMPPSAKIERTRHPEKLAKVAIEALKDAKVREVLETQAATPVGNTPAEFRAFIQAESAKYAKIVQLTGVKVK